ncbi:MAG: hypothetical protein KC731_43245, partial [Myxococcales bacterium]|nr:hypothetical protein [Myxococcales bacterium]
MRWSLVALLVTSACGTTIVVEDPPPDAPGTPRPSDPLPSPVDDPPPTTRLCGLLGITAHTACDPSDEPCIVEGDSCGSRLACEFDYNGDYDDRWLHIGPEQGTPCSDLGESCSFDLWVEND